MTKSEIVTILAEGTGLTKVETSAVIDGLIATLRYTLKENQHFELRGLGTFKVVERQARKVRNPNTGEMIEVPRKKALVFRVATDLKRYINDEEHSEE
jgi:DNA-binding protein HU-beta